MRFVLLILLLFPLHVYSQGPKTLPSYEYANGSIEIPALLSIKITPANNDQMELDQWSDFLNGKEFLGVCNVTVMSNVPWIISVKSESEFLTPSSPNAAANVPVNLIKIRNAPSGTYQELSYTPQSLFQSDNDNIINNYSIDMKLNRPFGYEGGHYLANIIFIISPQ